MARSVCVALVVGVFVAVVADAQSRAPEVTFGPDGVLVHGSRPGSKIAYLGVIRDAVDNHVRIRVVSGVETATNAGSLPIAEAGADESHSLWLVADVEAGSLQRARAPGYVTSARAIDIEAKHGEEMLIVRSPQVKLLYVRRAVGAWRISAYDGGAFDADGTRNGSITIALQSLSQLQGGHQPPQRTNPGDLILAIDPVEMRSWQVEVAP